MTDEPPRVELTDDAGQALPLPIDPRFPRVVVCVYDDTRSLRRVVWCPVRATGTPGEVDVVVPRAPDGWTVQVPWPQMVEPPDSAGLVLAARWLVERYSAGTAGTPEWWLGMDDLRAALAAHDAELTNPEPPARPPA